MIKVSIFGTGSDGNLSLLDDSVTAIMIDCGLNTKIIKDVSIYNRLKACIITHEHKDHSKFADKIAEIVDITNYCTTKVVDNFEITTVEAFHNIKNIAAYIYNKADDINIMWATDYYKISKLYNEIDYIFSEIFLSAFDPNQRPVFTFCTKIKDSAVKLKREFIIINYLKRLWQVRHFIDALQTLLRYRNGFRRMA